MATLRQRGDGLGSRAMRVRVALLATVLLLAREVPAAAQLGSLPEGATLIRPTGSLIGTTQADRAARVVDLNDYAVPSITGNDGAVSGIAFATTGTLLTACPAGASILIRAAGPGGVSFQTTVLSVSGPQALVLASAAPLAIASGALFYCGQDATPGIRAAFTRAASLGLAVRGRGAFWLASQTAPLPLSGLSVSSDGGPVMAFAPFIGAGLVFLVTGTTSAVFTPGVAATFAAAVFHPAQDGSLATPIAYPPVFDTPAAGLTTNFTIENAYFVNPYNLFSVEPGGGAGRVFVANTRAFCINRCFDIRNGQADTLQLDATDYFGPGVDPDSTVGNQYLRKYAAAYGEVIHLDPAATGSNYQAIDGLLISGGIWQGYRYGIRLISGLLDVSNVANLNLDSTPTALSVEGSSLVSMSWTGGEIYSSQNFASTAANNVFDLNTSSQAVDLTISGVLFPFAQGQIVNDAQVGLRRLNFTGNMVGSWGRSGATGNTFYVVAIGNNAVVRVAVTGNVMDGNVGAGNSAGGIFLGNAAAATVTGNVITATANPIVINGSVGAAAVFGNTTIATNGPHSIATTLTGTATMAGGTAATNNLDKP